VRVPRQASEVEIRGLEEIRDSWVEITGFGDPAPRYLLATDGREATIERAKAEYVYDRISLEELEERVAAALRGKTITPAAAIRHYAEAHKTHKVMVLPKGVTYTPLAVNGLELTDATWGTVVLPDPSHTERRG